jgi:hypothetical protein
MSEPFFGVPRRAETSRCPVMTCGWRSTGRLWEPGQMRALDDHMVAHHPTTEWSRRVVARRRRGIDTTT